MPPLLQDVFALSGIIAASRVTLQRYLAIASHRSSDQWVPREDEPGPSDANDLAEGTTPKTAFIITLIGAVAFPVLRLVIWLVADYAPVGLALVFFTLLLYLMHVGMVYMTTYVVYPGNPSLAIRRRQADMQFKVRVIGTDPYERLRVPIGFAFPAMVYALADTIVGPVLIPTLAFAWMAALVAMSTAERERGMGVKAVMALNGGLLMLFAACYIWALTESDPPSEPEDKKEPLKFPDWLLKLCMPMLDNCLTCVPAILIAITYRFEYTSLYPPLRSSTDPVPLPALRDTWDLPMTYSGLLGMAISIFGQHLVPKEYQILEHGFSMAAVVVIAPCTMLAVVLVAWRKGLFGEWWEYYEIWTPNIDEVRVMPMLLAEDVTAK